MTSFEFRGFQIDLIELSSDSWELARVLYPAELGHLLGTLAKSVGLKLSYSSLAIRYSTQHHGELHFELSRDPRAVLEYFGLDPTVPERGFSSQQEVADYVLGISRFDLALVKHAFEGKVGKGSRAADRSRRLRHLLEALDQLPGAARELRPGEMAAIHAEAAAFFSKSESIFGTLICNSR